MAFWRKEEKKKEPHDPQSLVARREYGKAIKAYRSLLVTNPENYVFNHKIADVYCFAGRQRDALDDYSKAADGYARDGFLIKAIAILKKMQRIDPGNPEAARRLEELSQQGSSMTGGRAAPAQRQEEPAGGPEIALDMEEIGEGAGIPVSAPEEAPAPPEGASVAAEPEPEPAAPAGEIPFEPEEAPEPAAPPETAPPPRKGLAPTPLFSEMTSDELRDVLARLRHHSFTAETTIIKEGEPGDSMFVIGQGRVKVTATGPRGRQVELAELGEGEFFGEVCLLTGKPRTATITSVEDLELLELTREDLDELESRHPRVRQVVKEFYERRVASTVETMLQEVRASRSRPGS